MRKSRCYFENAMFDRLLRLLAWFFLVIAINGSILIIGGAPDKDTSYTLIALIIVMLAVMVFIDSDTASYAFKWAEIEYKKEQLVSEFSTSNNYKKFLEYKTDNPDEFIATMREVVEILERMESLADENEIMKASINKHVLIEESFELVTHVLIDPGLLEEYNGLVDYVKNIENLVTKYSHARFPTVNKTSDKSPSEIIDDIEKLRNSSLTNIGSVNSKHMEEFLIDFNYVVSPEQASKNNTGPGTKKPFLHMTIREIMRSLKGEDI